MAALSTPVLPWTTSVALPTRWLASWGGTYYLGSFTALTVVRLSCQIRYYLYLVLPALVNKSVLIPLVVKLWLLPPVLLLVDSLWHCCAFEMLTVSLLLPSILGPASQPKPMSRIQHLNILVIA